MFSVLAISVDQNLSPAFFLLRIFWHVFKITQIKFLQRRKMDQNVVEAVRRCVKGVRWGVPDDPPPSPRGRGWPNPPPPGPLPRRPWVPCRGEFPFSWPSDLQVLFLCGVHCLRDLFKQQSQTQLQIIHHKLFRAVMNCGGDKGKLTLFQMLHSWKRKSVSTRNGQDSSCFSLKTGLVSFGKLSGSAVECPSGDRNTAGSIPTSAPVNGVKRVLLVPKPQNRPTQTQTRTKPGQRKQSQHKGTVQADLASIFCNFFFAISLGI